MLTINDFTSQVGDLVKDSVAYLKNNYVSDVTDEYNHQYVDLVQEGGGMLGIALVGYTYVLEEAGVRFYSLGGTSAGAINTMLLGGCGTLEEKKSEKILQHLATTNFFDFVDGSFVSKELIKSITQNAWLPFKLMWGLASINGLIENKGLNPGKNFYLWLSNILKENGVASERNLVEKRKNPAGLSIRKGIERNLLNLEPQLKIVAAEITTETRVIFPEMNSLFWQDKLNPNPAEYVRASMSIPGFFFPYKIKLEQKDSALWYDLARYGGTLPDEAVFVDGGIMSNFPIDLFHDKTIIPRLPTFGVKLNDNRNKINEVDKIPGFLGSIFNSARHVLDYQFLLQNEDYERLITKIHLDDHNWLNFSMKDNEKIALFIKGAKAARDFIIGFNWNDYKKVREEIAAKTVSMNKLVKSLPLMPAGGKENEFYEKG